MPSGITPSSPPTRTGSGRRKRSSVFPSTRRAVDGRNAALVSAGQDLKHARTMLNERQERLVQMEARLKETRAQMRQNASAARMERRHRAALAAASAEKRKAHSALSHIASLRGRERALGSSVSALRKKEADASRRAPAPGALGSRQDHDLRSA